MKINVIDRDGIKHEIDVDLPENLESIISQKGFQSDFGICGGSCACSSCQVYVEPDKFELLDKADDGEQGVLDDMAFEPLPTSRLGCQLELTEQMEGWTFTIAPY